MPQKMINDLTDRVSALTADTSRLTGALADERLRANRAEIELASLKQIDARRRQALAEIAVAYGHSSRESRRMAEWMNAIRLEIESRGTNANMETVLHYAQEALSGKNPHWMTDEYLSKTRDPRRKD